MGLKMNILLKKKYLKICINLRLSNKTRKRNSLLKLTELKKRNRLEYRLKNEDDVHPQNPSAWYLHSQYMPYLKEYQWG